MSLYASDFRQDSDQPFSAQRPKLGQMLLQDGTISLGDLLSALMSHKRLNVPLGTVLTALEFVSETKLFDTLAKQWSHPRFNENDPIDKALCHSIGLDFCLRNRAIPVALRDGVLIVAVSSLDAFATAVRDLENVYGLITPVIASNSEIENAINRVFHDTLADRAAHALPYEMSCRALAQSKMRRNTTAAVFILISGALIAAWPAKALTAMTFMAILLSVSSAFLKIFALLAHLLPKPAIIYSGSDTKEQPKVSVMVPLHREPDIAGALVERLSRLTYPKPLLEVLLVIEENDDTTRDAIHSAHLPAWIRPVYVPEGQPKTKPRALNHAYKFCTGDIIGIYDAEDAPDPDQIEKVVDTFAKSPPEVACLQGILQFYNPTQNWLARCFTMDYAAWFRVVLPGLSRLGVPVPLGGTTLFLRRNVIDNMHGWDAHNVTEDADLGLRLNRAGYRTELIDSVTGEEANCHGWRWIRQRSRWIKGYMVTYWAHMRNPVALHREIGTRGFLAFQTLFLGTILHFLTAPLLWSFWIVYLGYEHAFFNLTPPALTKVVAAMFLSTELLGWVIIAIACKKAERPFLIPWIPTISLYFLLAVPAGLKALWEFFRAPVFWDKTDHGHSLTLGSSVAPISNPVQPRTEGGS